jgi:hypothetical protein
MTARGLPGAVWAVAATIFFRTPIFSGFHTITGDEGDVRLVVFLHEHWWKVVQGDAEWRHPAVFFPAHDVLSYSDTFALNALLYVPLRVVGVDPFVAFQLCLMALTAVGFFSVYLLMRRHLGTGRLAASLLAATVAFANNLYIDTAHAQLFSVEIVPLIVLLAVEGWRAASRRAGLAWSAAAGATLGALLWSNFYFGWFAVVAAAIAGVVAGSLLVASGAGGAALRSVRARWERLAAAGGGAALMMVPFLLTYWPALEDGRQRPYDEVAGLAPRPFDMINAGRDNVLWGWLMRGLTGDDERLEQLNRATALTPVLLICTALAGVVLAADWRRNGRTALGVAGVAASVTAMVVVVLPVQFGFGGAWSWLHRFVPGGAAIRVYARIEVVNVLIAALAVACALQCQQVRRTASWVLTVALLGVIAVEQLNLTDNFRELDRDVESALLDGVPDPPRGCAAFSVVPPPGRNPDHASIDAMLISQRIGLPTVNGYSGWIPQGWNLQPGTASYASELRAWLDRNGLAEVSCTYDLDARLWH